MVEGIVDGHGDFILREDRGAWNFSAELCYVDGVTRFCQSVSEFEICILE